MSKKQSVVKNVRDAVHASSDYWLYFLIAAVGALQMQQWARSFEAWGNALLAGLIALKAKRSSNKKEDEK